MKRKSIIFFAIIAVVVLAFGAWRYVELRQVYKTTFPNNTVINGVDCSGLTADDATTLLTKTWNQRHFTIKDGTTTMAVLKGFDFTYDIKDSIKAEMEHIAKFPFTTTLFGKNKNITINMTPAFETKSFKNKISSLYVFAGKDYIETKNAYVDLSDTSFKVVPEVYGTNIDKTLLKKTILDMFGKGKTVLHYKKKDFYVVPSVTKNSQAIKDRLDYCKKYLQTQITYKSQGMTYTLTPAQLNHMVSYSAKGKATVRSSGVNRVVSSIASKFTTAGSPLSFKSTVSGTITIEGGSYGYVVSNDGEALQLTKDLKTGKDVTRQPIYGQTPKSSANGGVGRTYVEVSIANQHLWYYQNGKCKLSTPIVSGDEGKHDTVTGAFFLVYKSSDETLKGQNDDGSDYETEVAVWMPFYGGYGLHDAPWRGNKFGGKIYKGGGSHGCVNMPVAKAKRLYSLVAVGCPVIVY